MLKFNYKLILKLLNVCMRNVYIYIYLKHELDKDMRELNKYKKKSF